MHYHAHLEVRAQNVRGSSHRHGGPDRYVAIQWVPCGQKKLAILNTKVAKKRGIRLERLGEGYSMSTGPASSLGRAIAEGERRVAANEALPEVVRCKVAVKLLGIPMP